MTIEKKVTVELIEVIGEFVSVTLKTQIVEGEKILAETLEKKSIAPGECDASQPDVVKSVCSAVHTSDVVSNYKEVIAHAAADQRRIAAEKAAAEEEAKRQAELEILDQEQAQQAAFDAAVADAVRRALTGGQ